MLQDRLIVICEGGAHTVEYLHRNGVFPGAVVFEPHKFQEMAPYLTKGDDILLIVKGLTDFTMMDIYALLGKFDEHAEKFKRVTILTNINLGVIPYSYYLYTNDLFYGDVVLIENNKQYDLDENGNISEQKSKGLKLGRKVVKSDTMEQKVKKNPIMFAYKKYNAKDVKMMIYGTQGKQAPMEENVEYLGNIVQVDLFKGSGKIKESMEE